MNKVTNLTFSYDDKLIIDNYTNQFNKGINYISWESGKGKTTLLNLIADRHEGTRFGSISFMQQDTILFDWLKVSSNLSYLSPNKLPKSLLKDLGIADKLDLKISELSGGQKRRLYLAMILNLDSEVYLLDEPFTGTDEKTINKIMSYLKSLKDKTIIISSHKIKKA